MSSLYDIAILVECIPILAGEPVLISSYVRAETLDVTVPLQSSPPTTPIISGLKEREISTLHGPTGLS